MLTYYKACEYQGNITLLSVVMATAEHLIIINQLGREEKILRVGVNYACYDSWDNAYRYLLGWSNTKLNNLRASLKETIEQHNKIENLIKPLSNLMQVA